MTGKRLVRRDESARTHVYRAARSERATQRELVRDLADRAFGGSAVRLVMQALAAKKASPEELAEKAGRTSEPFERADRAAARELGNGSTVDHALVVRASMDAVHARLAAALPVVVAIWLAGVSLLLVRMGGGLWRVHRLHEAGLAAPVSRWQEVAARLASRLDLVDAVRVVESRLVGTPTLVGWMRPIVLLPVAALGNLLASTLPALGREPRSRPRS